MPLKLFLFAGSREKFLKKNLDAFVRARKNHWLEGRQVADAVCNIYLQMYPFWLPFDREPLEDVVYDVDMELVNQQDEKKIEIRQFIRNYYEYLWQHQDLCESIAAFEVSFGRKFERTHPMQYLYQVIGL